MFDDFDIVAKMFAAAQRIGACSRWLVAAGLPLVFASGCPQIASDFTKGDAPFDTEGSGGSSESLGGAGGTTPNLNLDTAAASGGSEANSSTSQSATDAGTGGSGGSSDGETSTSTNTATTAKATSSTATTSSATSSETTISNTTTSSTTTSGSTTGGDSCTDEICDGLDNDCSGEADDGQVCGWEAGCEGFEIDGHGYMFCARPTSVGEAESECSTQGMNLVQIDSEAENEKLVAAADQRWNSEGGSGGNFGGGNSNGNWGSWGGPGQEQQQPAFWTGGSDADSANDWIWTGSGTPFWEGASNGEPVADAYTNWGAGRPNDSNDSPEDCAAVYFREGDDGEVGTWNDLPCADPYPFICESP